MPATPEFGLRYPVAADLADVPLDMQELAEDVEGALNSMAPALPPGIINQYAGTTAPSGWLFCDGSEVSRTMYAELFAVIDIIYGAGDELTTFNLPDLLGRVPVGKSATGTFSVLGSGGGAETHQLSGTEMPSHAHGVNDPTHAHGVYDPGHSHSECSPTYGPGGGGSNPGCASYYNPATSVNGTGVAIYNSGTGISIQAAGSDGAHNNLQPYRVVNYIIKT